jgi:hypothetical protein
MYCSQVPRVVIEGDDTLHRPRQVGDDKADADKALYDNQTHCTAKYGTIRGMRAEGQRAGKWTGVAGQISSPVKLWKPATS